MLWWKW